MAAKRKLSTLSPEVEEVADPADELMFLCLGGGNEVGRSCHIIQYKGKTVMVMSLTLCVERSANSNTNHSSMLADILLFRVSLLCRTLTSSTSAPSIYY